jgi:uracil-DNA glycosylase family 4
MIVGQNPGGRGVGSQYQTAWSEGKTPEFLNDILKQAGIYLDCWFTNLVLCSTENNSINAKQISTCIANLEYQIQLINPDVIFALGGVAVKALKKSFPNKKIVEVAHPTYIKRFYSNNPEKIQEYINFFRSI